MKEAFENALRVIFNNSEVYCLMLIELYRQYELAYREEYKKNHDTCPPPECEEKLRGILMPQIIQAAAKIFDALIEEIKKEVVPPKKQLNITCLIGFSLFICISCGTLAYNLYTKNISGNDTVLAILASVLSLVMLAIIGIAGVNSRK